MCFASHAERGAEFDVGFFHHIHHLVAQQGLVGIGGVQASELARVAVDGVALRNLHAVDVQRGHLAKRCGFAHSRKLGKAKALVFKRNAANGQGQARSLAAAAVDVEIGECELCH